MLCNRKQFENHFGILQQILGKSYLKSLGQEYSAYEDVKLEKPRLLNQEGYITRAISH